VRGQIKNGLDEASHDNSNVKVSCFKLPVALEVHAKMDIWHMDLKEPIKKDGSFVFPLLDKPPIEGMPWILTIEAQGARFNENGKVWVAEGQEVTVHPPALCVISKPISGLSGGYLAQSYFLEKAPFRLIRFFQNPEPELPASPSGPNPSAKNPYPWEKGENLASQQTVLDDSDPTRRAIFEPSNISQLPISGNRNIDSFALLAPGVGPPPQAGTSSGPGISPSVGTAGQVVVNGIRPRLNNFMVDGVDDNDEDAGVRREGFIFAAPYSLESIREFQILTSLYDAQYGRGSGGQLNVLTKTGTGRFHATAYGYLSDSALAARNYFNPAFSEKDPNTNYASGVVLDIPTGRDFFLSVAAEWRRDHASQTGNFAVPTFAERSFQDAPALGLSPLTNSFLGVAVFSLFPFPNNPQGPYGANTFTEQLPASGQGILYSAKLDRSLSRLPLLPSSWSHRLYVSGAGTAESNTLPETGGSLFSSLRPNVHTYTGSVILTTNAGPSAANSLRVSFGEAFYIFGSAPDPRMLTSSYDGGDPFLLNAPLLLSQSAYSPGCPVFVPPGTTECVTGPLGQVSVAGFSGLGVDVFHFPQYRRDQTLGASDLVTFLPGQSSKTTVSIGLEFWHYRFKNNANPNAVPYLAFNGAPNGGSFFHPPDLSDQPAFFSPADTVSVGLPAVYEQTLLKNSNTDLSLYRNQVDGFAVVNRRIGDRFTVTASLRAESNGLPYSTDGRFESNYYQSLSSLTAAPGCYDCAYYLPLLKAAFPPAFNSVFAANRITFDPRIGFSWNPTGNGNWAIRGGVGRYTSQFPASILDESRSIFPNSFTLNTAGTIGEFDEEGAGSIPVVYPYLQPLT
jgi:hypothetical protein